MCELSCSSSGGNSVVRCVVVLRVVLQDEFCLANFDYRSPRVLPGNWLVARVVVDLKKLLHTCIITLYFVYYK